MRDRSPAGQSSADAGRPGRVAATLLATALCALPCAAILIRHDRADARYQELGAQQAAVGHFARMGSGTLIGDRWVLTAAHVARAAAAQSLPFTVGSRSYPIAEAIVEPRWREGGPFDVGLVRLSEPVSGVEPVAICARDPEVGATLLLAGWGDSGTGLSGPSPGDPTLRAARNVLARAEEDWLVFAFDAPPQGDDLEGMGGPGDSGGPALVPGPPECVVGVSVWGDGHGKGPGRYGADDGYARVVPERAWIAKVQAAAPH